MIAASKKMAEQKVHKKIVKNAYYSKTPVCNYQNNVQEFFIYPLPVRKHLYACYRYLAIA